MTQLLSYILQQPISIIMTAPPKPIGELHLILLSKKQQLAQLHHLDIPMMMLQPFTIILLLQLLKMSQLELLLQPLQHHIMIVQLELLHQNQLLPTQLTTAIQLKFLQDTPYQVELSIQ